MKYSMALREFKKMVNDVVLIGSDTLGAGDEKLGAILMSSFLRLLGQREDLPEFIILWNTGVKLAARDTEASGYLQVLQEKGVKIISCRTCIEYFGLEESLVAGEIDGMVRIQEILAGHNVLTV